MRTVQGFIRSIRELNVAVVGIEPRHDLQPKEEPVVLRMTTSISVNMKGPIRYRFNEIRSHRDPEPVQQLRVLIRSILILILGAC